MIALGVSLIIGVPGRLLAIWIAGFFLHVWISSLLVIPIGLAVARLIIVASVLLLYQAVSLPDALQSTHHATLSTRCRIVAA